MAKKGFGVIGLGNWGELHAKVYSNHPDAELVAVCDTRRDRAEAIAREYGAMYSVTDFNELLALPGIDAVSIATPDFAHLAPVIAAARAGKDILVEKPLATTVPECQQMVSEARTAGVKLMVDFHSRWFPPFIEAKKSVDSGELGDVLHAHIRLNDTLFVPRQMLSWSGKTTVLWFLGCHCVDILRWIMNSEVKRVYAVSKSRKLVNEGIDTPDFFETTLEFENEAVAVIENSWVLPTGEPTVFDYRLEMYGTNEAIKANIAQNESVVRIGADRLSYPVTLVATTVHGRPAGAALDAIAHFVDCVVAGKTPAVTGEDGLEATKVLCGIEESVKSGRPVVIR